MHARRARMASPLIFRSARLTKSRLRRRVKFLVSAARILEEALITKCLVSDAHVLGQMSDVDASSRASGNAVCCRNWQVSDPSRPPRHNANISFEPSSVLIAAYSHLQLSNARMPPSSWSISLSLAYVRLRHGSSPSFCAGHCNAATSNFDACTGEDGVFLS
jgi:hypothetical protein